ncbi:unnamed protein product [Cuscuta campestris]|uniref:Uncharacterized protein n=1 Tax=Cuscuta campestris TaxID=132261 RepID=A0A484MK66_9ASTE|nr:unnamed protein product [Cuscuta campestris]
MMMMCSGSGSATPLTRLYHLPRRAFYLPPISRTIRLQNDALRPENLTARNYSSSALPFDRSPPPIDHDLIDDKIETYVNDADEEALSAVENGVAVGA